jgi:hypothetical protein
MTIGFANAVTKHGDRWARERVHELDALGQADEDFQVDLLQMYYENLGARRRFPEVVGTESQFSVATGAP